MLRTMAIYSPQPTSLYYQTQLYAKNYNKLIFSAKFSINCGQTLFMAQQPMKFPTKKIQNLRGDVW
mgnify:CR=1 FL=1